jgi:hypothetical protein
MRNSVHRWYLNKVGLSQKVTGGSMGVQAIMAFGGKNNNAMAGSGRCKQIGKLDLHQELGQNA